MAEKIASTTEYYINPLDIIVEDGFNSRIDFGDLDLLSQQIVEQGLLNPISVCEVEVDGVTKFKLVDGERRYRAIMLALSNGHHIGLIKATFVDGTDKTALLMEQYMRNEQKNFNEYEKALVCKKLRDEGLTNAEIARRLSLNIGVVTYCFKHLERDERVQKLMAQGVISGSEVRRIYQAHKGDEISAVNDIVNTWQKVKEEGKKTITSKDIKASGRAKVIKDTTLIKKALPLLISYIGKYADENGKLPFKFTLKTLNDRLKGRNTDLVTIEDIFNEMRGEQIAKSV